MNRRDFTKVSFTALAAMLALPMLALKAGASITWKEFDWAPLPSLLAFRLEDHGSGFLRMTSLPYSVKTTLLRYISPINVDWTKECHEVEMNNGLPFKQIVYTNGILLKAAKEIGYTHLHSFVSMPFYNNQGQLYHGYAVRGAKLPKWKLINGNLQVVKI